MVKLKKVMWHYFYMSSIMPIFVTSSQKILFLGKKIPIEKCAISINEDEDVPQDMIESLNIAKIKNELSFLLPIYFALRNFV